MSMRSLSMMTIAAMMEMDMGVWRMLCLQRPRVRRDFL